MMDSQRFIFKEMGSDLMCYDCDEDEVHILNLTASAVYRLLCEGKSETEIVQSLAVVFPGHENKEIEKDVRTCIEDLEAKGLLDR
jgi:hypothetical protein